VDFNFATGISGDTFDCSAPVNDSPNNTGGMQLPPANPAWIWYPYGFSPDWPQIPQGRGGRTAMAGPTYHYDENLESDRKLPEFYDKAVFLYEWSRRFILVAKLDENGDILSLDEFLPSFDFSRPIDMEMGTDGAIYMLEWGSNFGGNSADARLIRIDYKNGDPMTSVNTGAGPVVPKSITLHQAYPNPFNPNTRISFELPELMHVKLEVFDLLGRKIATLVNSALPAGVHAVEFEALDIPSGFLIYRLSTPQRTVSRKMILIK
jgi:cytochrome c